MKEFSKISRIRLSITEFTRDRTAPLRSVSLHYYFLRREFVSISLKHKAGGPTLTSVRDCTFNTFEGTLHICRPFLHHQREEAPCRGDKERYTTDSVNKESDGVT